MKKPISYTGEETYAFISYCHRNDEFVWDTLCDLQKRGFRFWYDDGIEIGSSWDDMIGSHVEECKCFLAFISSDYAKSKNCNEELRYALTMEKDIVLVRLDDTKLSSGLEMRLCASQSINYYELDSAEYLEKLTNAECLSDLFPKKEAAYRRGSYKEKNPALVKILKQSYYREALYSECEMIDDILFWCLYNMGFYAMEQSVRIREKVHNDVVSILNSFAEHGTGVSVSTLAGKLSLIETIFDWANRDESPEIDQEGFKVLKKQLKTNQYPEYKALFEDTMKWNRDVQTLLIDSIKKSSPATGNLSELAAQGQSLAKSLDEVYRSMRRGNKIRSAFGLK